MRFKPSIYLGLGLGFIALIACSGPQRKLASVDTSESKSQKLLAFTEGSQEFEDYREEKNKQIAFPDIHGPKFLSHGHPTEYVVVFMHGLFESPHFSESIANNFFQRGMNVVMPTLPGHWTSHKAALDRTKPEELNEEAEYIFSIAQKLGKNVILSGYSMGGMLAVRGALAHPEEVKGLLLWAPSLGLTTLTHTAKEAGYLLRFSFPSLSGNDFIRMEADGQFIPYLSSNAPILVNKAAKSIFNDFSPKMKNHVILSDPYYGDRHVKTYEKISVPTFIVYSKKDELVDHNELRKFYSSLSGEKERIVYTNTRHIAIPKAANDARNFYNSDLYNEEADQMFVKMNNFMDKYFPMSTEAKLEAQKTTRIF